MIKAVRIQRMSSLAGWNRKIQFWPNQIEGIMIAVETDRPMPSESEQNSGSNETDSNESVRSNASGSRIIGRLLPPAVRLWLRSQVEAVSQLTIELEGRDRQIISGYLPGVVVAAQQAIYRGIYISSLRLTAQDIRINIGQVLRGKPLRLLKAFPVSGDVTLSAEDLNASLSSPLLAEGLLSFWQSLMATPFVAQSVQARYGDLPIHPDATLGQPQICLGENYLGLSFYPGAGNEMAEQPVVLKTKLSLVDSHILQLGNPRWLNHLDEFELPDAGTPVQALEGFQWDLGKDTQLTTLKIQPAAVLCCGQIAVNP